MYIVWYKLIVKEILIFRTNVNENELRNTFAVPDSTIMTMSMLDNCLTLLWLLLVA